MATISAAGGGALVKELARLAALASASLSRPLPTSLFTDPILRWPRWVLVAADEADAFFASEGGGAAANGDGPPVLTPEEREALTAELTKTEDEINTLRQVFLAFLLAFLALWSS